MGKLVTANVATNLYWLGRHLERTETTLYKLLKAYDEIIDVNKNAGKELYKQFDIELEYTGAKNFLHVAIQGEHAANILDMMTNARESAIISRHHIDTEAFGEIIELHALFKEADSDIDYKIIDKALSLVSEIWGALSKREHTNNAYLFFRMGKLVEEADLRIRFDKDEVVTLSVIEEIDSIVLMLQEEDNETPTQSQTQGDEEVDLLGEVNTKINKIIVE